MSATFSGPWKLEPYTISTDAADVQIANYKQLSTTDHIAESWEASALPGYLSKVISGPDSGLSIPQLIEKYGASLLGRRVEERYGKVFPLLMKVLDCSGDLTMQVHPADDVAARDFGSIGREEFWYILDAPEDAEVMSGFTEVLTKEDFIEKVTDRSIINYVARTPARPGDAFYIPAGRLHTVTPGILILQILDPAMSGYDVFSFDDSRNTTIRSEAEAAAEVVDLTVMPSYRTEPEPPIDGIEGLAHTSHFTANRIAITGRKIFYNYEDTFILYHCIGGMVKIWTDDKSEAVELTRGQSALLGASAKRVVFDGNGVVISAQM